MSTMTYTLTYKKVDNNPFSLRARAHVRLNHKAYEDKIKEFTAVTTPVDERLQLSWKNVTPATPVGIVGAGVAGLYTAMILDSLGIPFEIIEQSGRVGGRVFTFKFDNNKDGYQYFDVGAMRFPRTPFMNRTFDLVKKVNRGISTPIELIDYHFASIGALKELQYYNGRQLKNGKPENLADAIDPFHVNAYRPRYIPAKYSGILQPAVIKDVLAQIMWDLKADFRNPKLTMEEAMERLVLAHDKDSMRSYLTNNPKYAFPSEVIHLLETFDKSTGWYDRALVESVCESLAFEWIEEEVKYVCIDGGSSKLPEGMEEYLTRKGHTVGKNVRVTSIEYAPYEGPAGLIVKGRKTDLNVTKYEREFAAVISTAPLSTLNLIDLTGCGINDNYAQYSAIRELQYGPSIKVGIQFTENWWEALGLIGGQSFTDLPIRTVVYPSYPPGNVTKSRVLIASYCWTQDAERLGAFIDSKTGKISDDLREIVLRNLEKVHGLEAGFLNNKVEDAFAFDWLHNPFTQGAFAFFGPQEFGDKIYHHMRQPAARGQLFFAGEATSGCHAWVAGALDSAWHSVWEFLHAYGYPEEIKEEFRTKWGSSEYWDDYDQMRDHFLLGLARSGMTPEGHWPTEGHPGQRRPATQ
ncbi:hypothetical protein EXIGLDRAFT_752364 [Exidia glandulosa HHB12029]|uniref:Amine oxidase domain-containing protein n=1 Tax=Exidia glandulosa HHB12029 TaxID=1314781 RepID=A0A165ELI7_EXIGL|nr:hypothetical protein EXIGLDRAFT_752364 [Exidia glandulosa HHB12029]